MGSSSSKGAAACPPEAMGRTRSRGVRLFRSPCLGLPSVSSQDQIKQEGGKSKINGFADKSIAKSNQGNHERCSKHKIPQSSQLPSSNSSSAELNEEGQESASHADSGASSSSATEIAITQSSNPSSRSRSPFGFIHDGISFRLRRAASLGSSCAHSLISASFSVPNSHGGEHVHRSTDALDSRNGTLQESTIADTVSSRDTTRSNTGIEAGVSGYSQRNRVGTENFETRRPNIRLGSLEPLEGSIRFSRTRSVGRLRDRVLHRTPFSERLFGSWPLEGSSTGYTGHGNGRRVGSGVTRQAYFSDGNAELLPASSSSYLSSIDNSMDNTHAYEAETPQLREAGNRDILEHRSAFLERRRRIRSQVRALQRLGSRFENLSGHNRSCILSGQHRTGHCTCRTSSRAVNPDDDMSTRASISRIVMLAEALFEVLDEIHQQAVVPASRPSVSSIGSVPAPKEVVESMPVRMYMKPQKHQNEDAAQCYICLVEYEEGDCMRILPCYHEFHRMCIDKWLKEIHRVCPLCRGDVCGSDVSPLQKLN